VIAEKIGNRIAVGKETKYRALEKCDGLARTNSF